MRSELTDRLAAASEWLSEAGVGALEAEVARLRGELRSASEEIKLFRQGHDYIE